ncbi:type II toxin-antitoxin system VapC family toxin [Arthrobacter roseus]|uniref:type II toxin-antitoxin system VapC family toxin n=1 Tax=Arthrobacter roseus TaxID=136274 RepID=UPI001963F0D5|nr:type II toxin-antitoxin system VapC family toxin [Arthrobacter roseus]MBM7847811.1 putative nucleic acid-binding protein [Arthrobacter roseus]
MIIYIDTSAALKLVIDEPESAALADHLSAATAEHTLVASMLLHADMHCAARRQRNIPAELINTVLNSINLVDVARSDLMYAAAMPHQLRSADAIHLATAIRVQAQSVLAYDHELMAAATDAGLSVVSPGFPTKQ